MCWDGNLIATQRLFDDGADANTSASEAAGFTPLLLACDKTFAPFRAL